MRRQGTVGNKPGREPQTKTHQRHAHEHTRTHTHIHSFNPLYSSEHRQKQQKDLQVSHEFYSAWTRMEWQNPWNDLCCFIVWLHSSTAYLNFSDSSLISSERQKKRDNMLNESNIGICVQYLTYFLITESPYYAWPKVSNDQVKVCRSSKLL